MKIQNRMALASLQALLQERMDKTKEYRECAPRDAQVNLGNLTVEQLETVFPVVTMMNAIAQKGAKGATSWVVESFTQDDKYYVVTKLGKRWTCTCPHYVYNLAETHDVCKHIKSKQGKGKRKT